MMTWKDYIVPVCLYLRPDQKDLDAKVGLQCTLTKNDYILTSLCLILLVVGLINNAMSLLVFYSGNYHERLIFLLLMKCFYVANISSVITIAASNLTLQLKKYYCFDNGTFFSILHENIFMSSYISMDMSYTILALMAVTRFLYCKFPYYVHRTSKFGLQATVILLLVILTLTTGFNLRNFFVNSKQAIDDFIKSKRIYICTLICINIVFNIMGVVERKRQRLVTTAVTKRLNNYLLISSVLSVVTTLPHVTIYFVPVTMAHQALTPSYCENIELVKYIFYILAYSSMCLDNPLYYLLSERYRDELRIALSRLVDRISRCRQRNISDERSSNEEEPSSPVTGDNDISAHHRSDTNTTQTSNSPQTTSSGRK